MFGRHEYYRIKTLARANDMTMNELVRGLVIDAITRRETEAAE